MISRAFYSWLTISTAAAALILGALAIQSHEPDSQCDSLVAAVVPPGTWEVSFPFRTPSVLPVPVAGKVPMSPEGRMKRGTTFFLVRKAMNMALAQQPVPMMMGM